MEITYSTQAIVLHSQPWNEYDSRVLLYSLKAGQLELIARGTRKLSSKLAGHLQPYNLVQLMVINGRYYSYAGAAVSLASWLELKQDWSKLATANFVSKIWRKLIVNPEPDARLFSLLANFFKIVNQITAEDLYYEFLAKSMLLKALCYLGYQPDIDLKQNSFGFLNRQDYYWQKITPASLAVIHKITSQDWPQSIKHLSFSRSTAKVVNKLIGQLIQLVIDR